MTKQMGAVPINRKTWDEAAYGGSKQVGGGDISQRQMGDGHRVQVAPGSYRSVRDAWPEHESRQMVHSIECTQQMG